MNNRKSGAWRVAFFGERRIASNALKMLCSGQFKAFFDLRLLISNKRFEHSYRQINSGENYKFISNERRHESEIIDAMKAHNIDLILSVQHKWILSGRILDIVNRNAFNLHNAKLPDFKGYNAVSHALLRGETSYTSTIHWMDDVVDSGDIAYVTDVPIGPADTAVQLYLKTVAAATGTWKKLLVDLSSRRPITRQPIIGKGTFFGRNDLEALRDITNVRDPVEFDRRVRAMFFPPINAAYMTTAHGRAWVLPQLAFPVVDATWISASEPLWDEV